MRLFTVSLLTVTGVQSISSEILASRQPHRSPQGTCLVNILTEQDKTIVEVYMRHLASLSPPTLDFSLTANYCFILKSVYTFCLLTLE